MARVHMFKSSSDKQNKSTHLLQPEDLPPSPSLPNGTEEGSSLDVMAAESQASTNDTSSTAPSSHDVSAALAAALLQKTSNTMDSASTILYGKSESLNMLNQESRKQLLSTLQQSAAKESPETKTSSETVQDKLNGRKDPSTEFFDQAAAATALQLLGLAQQNNAAGSSSSSANDFMRSFGAHALLSPQQKDNHHSVASPISPKNNTSSSSSSKSGTSPTIQQPAGESAGEEMAKKRGAWTAEEDELLLAGIKKFGYGRWKEIATIIPGRKGKQLKQRWDNSLAAKYVDQKWLQNKIKDEQPSTFHENRDSSSPAQSLPNESPVDWSLVAQKISEKLKDGDQTAIEALISQILLSSLQSVANQGTASSSSTSNPIVSTSNTNSNAQQQPILPYTDPLLLLLPHLLQQQQQQQKSPTQPPSLPRLQPSTTENAHHFYIIPAPSTTATSTQSTNNSTALPGSHKKRKRSDPALANTQSDAMSIYASSTPITTTIDNQTQTFYPCLFPNCGKTFARLYNLKSHSRTHTDDRPYVCNICQIAFSRNHDLKRHGKIHGGDRPYKCSGCYKSFSRLDALKRHKSNLRSKPACVNAPILPASSHQQQQ